MNLQMISRFLLVATLSALVGLLAGAPPAVAHRLPVALTTIEVLDDGRLGITHRLHAHDAISVLSGNPDLVQPEIGSVRSQAKIAVYARNHFLLGLSKSGKDPVAIETEIVGAELQGDYLYVYQETRLPRPLRDLYIRSDLLREIGGDWLSHVNLETNGKIRTVTFSGKPRWKKIDQ